MVRTLVMQLIDFQSREIARSLERAGHNVSFVDNDNRDSRNDKILGRLIQILGGDIDIFFIDGMIAYNIELRRSLNRGGLNKLPFLVSYPTFISDENLGASGCDFGKENVLADTYPSDIATALDKYPIPKMDGVVHNPALWREENGFYLKV